MDRHVESWETSGGHPISRAAASLATLGASVVGIAAVAAVVYLCFLVVGELAHPGTLARDLALTAVAAVVAIAVVAIVLRVTTRAPARGLVVAVAVFAACRAALVVALDGSLATDWLAHHRLAIGWTLGAPPIANRPMGYPILLGEAYRWAGSDPVVGEVLGLLMALVGIILLAAWVRLVAGTSSAAVAVAILAVSPSQGLHMLLLGTETTFATATTGVVLLATLMLRSVGEHGSGRRPLLLAAATGLLLGLSVYVRPTGLAIAPFLVLMLVLALTWQRGARICLVVACAFGLALLPAVAINQATLDRWSPTTSLYLGWQLFVGTNIDAWGQRTRADVEAVDRAVPGYRAGRVPLEYAQGVFDPATLRTSAARDDVAFAMAVARIQRDWPKLPGLLPAKFAVGWGPGDSATAWIPSLRPAKSAASLTSQMWWVAVLAGAAAWYVRRHRRESVAGLVGSSVFLPIALGLLVLEVQPRYHEYVVPLVTGFAAMWLTSHLHTVGPPSSTEVRSGIRV